MLDIFDFESRKVNKTVADRNPYTDDFFNERLSDLENRVDEKRYLHTLGVIEMAKILAEVYNVDVKKARLAAVIHDWDKCYNDEEMRKRIFAVGANTYATEEIIDDMPKVLHGVTAAFALGIEFPNIPSDVLRAVINHTTGNVRMSKLDMVIYIADALDPSREYEEYDELVNLIGKISLEDLFYQVYMYSTISVIKAGKSLHPKTAEIWNANVEKYNLRHIDD